jgi:opacity protein-like surface antigen
MNLRTTPSLILILIAFGICNLSYAQDKKDKKSVEQEASNNFINNFSWVDKNTPGIHEINFVGGYSFHSTRGFWGKTPGAELRLFVLRYNRKLLYYNKKHLIEYVGEINFSANYNVPSSSQILETGYFSGFGLAPVGLQFNLWKDNPVQPFFKSSGGFMLFNKRFPDERGTRFNFTLELGGGVEFILSHDLSLSLGYKYHHLSNGELGQANPGVDSNVFYAGITIF